MADLVQDSALVVMSADGRKKEGIAGMALTGGMPVYYDVTIKKYMACETTTEAEAQCRGFVVNDSVAANQTVDVCYRDKDLNVGVSVGLGQPLAVSNTTGKVALDGDILTGEWYCPLGCGNANGNVAFDLTNPEFVWASAQHV